MRRSKLRESSKLFLGLSVLFAIISGFAMAAACALEFVTWHFPAVTVSLGVGTLVVGMVKAQIYFKRECYLKPCRTCGKNLYTRKGAMDCINCELDRELKGV